jgi:hypothetical protein
VKKDYEGDWEYNGRSRYKGRRSRSGGARETRAGEAAGEGDTEATEEQEKKQKG